MGARRAYAQVAKLRICDHGCATVVRMKQQLVHIHGGEAFDSYEEYVAFLRAYEIDDPASERPVKWRDRYEEFLGDDWQVIRPQMPSPRNAKYAEWELWFEKYVPYLRESVVLVGHSLGAVFLVRFLAANTLPVRAAQLHLVAGPSRVPGGFALPDDCSGVESQCDAICIYHSRDDDVVPFDDAAAYRRALPTAEFIALRDRGHVLTPEFPELVKRIVA